MHASIGLSTKCPNITHAKNHMNQTELPCRVSLTVLHTALKYEVVAFNLSPWQFVGIFLMISACSYDKCLFNKLINTGKCMDFQVLPKSSFLNQVRADWRLACDWFLEIAFVRDVCMRVHACVCVCVCVCACVCQCVCVCLPQGY